MKRGRKGAEGKGGEQGEEGERKTVDLPVAQHKYEYKVPVGKVLDDVLTISLIFGKKESFFVPQLYLAIVSP